MGSMSFVNILPSFNPENRKLYGWARERVDVARKQADTAPTPEDSAAIRRYADRLQTGMRIKKAGDACETTGLILLQIAGCTFPAGLFSATACIAVGGAFVGGMLLYLGAILSGSSNQPTRHVLAGPTGAKDALTFSRYQQEMLAIERLQAESAKQTARRSLNSVRCSKR